MSDDASARLLGAIDERSQRTLETVLRIEGILAGHTAELANHEGRIQTLEDARKEGQANRRDWIGRAVEAMIALGGWVAYFFHPFTATPPPK